MTFIKKNRYERGPIKTKVRGTFTGRLQVFQSPLSIRLLLVEPAPHAAEVSAHLWLGAGSAEEWLCAGAGRRRSLAACAFLRWQIEASAPGARSPRS